MAKLKKNQATCNKCGDTIESKSRHDFVTCKCGELSVDGGLDYTRRVFVDRSAWTEQSEWNNESAEQGE
jgi:tRNA(Ile2) C34 agmatinyltransferase TiaS